MRCLIPGSNGFVGNHLKNELSKRGDKVFNFDIKQKQDITDYEQIRNYLDKIRPDEIYHLAAQAFVPESYNNPQRTFQINVIGSINLLEAVRHLGIKPKILLAGSSEEYGDADCKEGNLPNPQSPYAISKMTMTALGNWYAKAFGLHIVSTRAFNHTGPGRGEMYAESSWAKQIAEIEAGKREFIEHGNLDSVRIYTDVRDMVRAYTMAINLEPGIYNISSNQKVSMGEILQILISYAEVPIITKLNPTLCRPTDFKFSLPDTSKFVSKTKWKPEYNLAQTLQDLLEYWRKNI